ncbi:adenosylhomocysteinase [Candidatus Micrarchaeota archaeon]|nr:adenosylhomocysteinase [Candidatus Micrarchaeota archaeon]
MSLVKDKKLADSGKKNIEWAERHMPVLGIIRQEFERTKPLQGKRIAACLHVTKETAVLVKTLRKGGAEVSLCASNPLSTQDDVAAALDADGFPVYAIKGCDNETYFKCINEALNVKPHITIDDGADLINAIHTKRRELLKDIIAGQEETTTGVIRLWAMAKDGALKYPVIAVNDTPTKHLMDNWYGTAQSTLDGVIRATNELIAGKVVVVAGYGHCGKGVASRARGLGARVVITEINPVEGIRAYFEGFQVMKMADAAKIGDIFITVTGNKHVVTEKHFESMKDGAVVCNSGHFDVEINVKQLQKLAANIREVRPLVEEYKLKNGKKIILLARGRLVNLSCAEGHPSEVMDLSFSDQALVAGHIARNADKLKEKKVYEVPAEIDARVALLKAKAHGLGIDELTPEQKAYLESWKEGT